ncbi:Protein of unknown function [Bacillus mycoides]|uniref:Uncharacterized protein n=1 Tax=Bacillus mycoides TaxID=1405 RepID=A0A1G4LCJ4_BACMY|nr:Protein of unknown function [Bacillus mycoides]
MASEYAFDMALFIGLKCIV